MLRVNRDEFTSQKEEVGADQSSSIGFGATISSPYLHAWALEEVSKNLKPGAKVLDIGSGSGYLCAAFSVLTKPGMVIGVEHISELVDKSILNLSKSFREELNEKQIQIECRDARETV